MIYRREGVEWDGVGTLVLAGQKFPAALMGRVTTSGVARATGRFPIAGDATEIEWWDGPVNPNDQGCVTGWTVSVPLENGAVMAVTLTAEHGLVLLLRAFGWPRDTRDVACWQEGLEEPVMLFVDGKRIVPWSFFAGRHQDSRLLSQGSWDECEPEWAAEHIARLNVMPVIAPYQLVKAAWLRSLWDLAGMKSAREGMRS